MKRKDILCAVDFSPSSLQAMRWAFEQAGEMKASVVVLFCYRLVAAMDDEETFERKRRIEHEALRKFKEFERKYLTDQPVSYQFLMEAGYPHFRIEIFLQQNPVALLVVGSTVVPHFDEYGASGFDKFIRNLKVPLAVIPSAITADYHALNTRNG